MEKLPSSHFLCHLSRPGDYSARRGHQNGQDVELNDDYESGDRVTHANHERTHQLFRDLGAALIYGTFEVGKKDNIYNTFPSNSVPARARSTYVCYLSILSLLVKPKDILSLLQSLKAKHRRREFPEISQSNNDARYTSNIKELVQKTKGLISLQQFEIVIYRLIMKMGHSLNLFLL